MTGSVKTNRTAAVIVASTSAAAGHSADTTGPLICRWLTSQGFSVQNPAVVADGAPVGQAVRDALAAQRQVVIVTGGTGVSADDQSPEMVTPLLEVELPGIIDAIRRRGEASTAMSIITRGVAGFAGNTFVITLPGSSGGVKDGLAVLEPILDHLLTQRSGLTGHGPR